MVAFPSHSPASMPTAEASWFHVPSPTNACDSSGAAELYQNVRCAKAIAGLRIFLRQIGRAPSGHTVVYTDARVLIDGTRCQRVSPESKWVSPRYAIIRHAEKVCCILLIKHPTPDNLADITTKPLTGALFDKFRYQLICLPSAAARPPAGF